MKNYRFTQIGTKEIDAIWDELEQKNYVISRNGKLIIENFINIVATIILTGNKSKKPTQLDLFE